MSVWITRQYLKKILTISLWTALLFNNASASIPCELAKMGRSVYKTLHPFQIAGKLYQHQEIKMIQNKPLRFKGLVLGNGTKITGKVIDFYTKSSYSHVMFLLENKDNPLETFCYQSNVSQRNLSRFIWPQVNVVPYQEAVNSYPGSLYQRNFKFDQREGPSPTQVFSSIEKYLGRPYEQHLLEYLRSTRRDNKKEDSSSIFCSELIALVLQDLGYLPSPVTCQTAALADNYLPSDFAEGTDSFLRLKRVKLGQQRIIKEQ